MASRPAEGDDQDRRRQRAAGQGANGSAGSPRLVPKAAAPRLATRELCRRAKSKPRRYLVAYQPLRQKATIAAASPPDRVKLGFLRHPARPGRVVRILGLSGLGNHGQIAGFADPANQFTDNPI